ncbi:MAG TPA: hypothetical protein VJ208_03330 [Candidatus Nanoarchaeia archaeon]|nr:hypothetical protein [Candidatus Nanoarchaeia archaeon]
MLEKSLEECAETGHSPLSRIILHKHPYLHCGNCGLVYEKEIEEDFDGTMNVFVGARKEYSEF